MYVCMYVLYVCMCIKYVFIYLCMYVPYVCMYILPVAATADSVTETLMPRLAATISPGNIIIVCMNNFHIIDFNFFLLQNVL